MRPFRKIFLFSVGLVLFFFLIRVFVAALFIAALISIPYLFFRGLKSVFRREYDYDYRNPYRQLPPWQEEDEPLFYGSKRQYTRVPDYRYVDVQ